MSKILFLGPESPPVTGYANIVSALKKCLVLSGKKVYFLSTVPSVFSILFPNVSWKIIRLLYLIIILPYVLLIMPFFNLIYVNINGGVSQIFDVLILVLAKIFNKKVIFHHNSFSYINNPTLISKILFSGFKNQVTHVVNCKKMARLLENNFKLYNQVLVVSNASILLKARTLNHEVLKQKKSNDNKKEIVIGYMGYYNSDKGVDLYSSTVAKLHASMSEDADLIVKGLAVGPVHDELLYSALIKKYEALIDFCEPISTEAIENFFNSIDILLFPSRYKNEAEPLVVHHALEYGVPVIATDLGCVPDVVNNFKQGYIFKEDVFVKCAAEKIKDLYVSGELNKELRNSVKKAYVQYSQSQLLELDAFLLTI